MNSKLTLLVFFVGLWVGLASLHAATDVTITKTAPIEHLRPDGTPVGVAMSTPGTHYTFIKPGTIGADGQIEIIVGDSTGDQYRIAIVDTDYRPTPTPAAAAPNTADAPSASIPVTAVTKATAAVSVQPSASSTPPGPNAETQQSQSAPSESDITTFLDKTGLTGRFDRLLSKLSNPDTLRRLNDMDASDVQSFEGNFTNSDTRAKYLTIFTDAATKAYAQFTPDDITAINAYLDSPLFDPEKNNPANNRAVPNIPGSVEDEVEQNQNDYQAKTPFQTSRNLAFTTLRQLGLPQFTLEFHNSLPRHIADGEIDGIVDGLLATPSYAKQADAIKSLATAAKAIPAKSKYLQDVDNEIATRRKSMGLPPPHDPMGKLLRDSEEGNEARAMMCVYTSRLNKDQVTAWQTFATSSAGKKFYALRISALQAVVDAIDADWYTQRHDAAKTWTQSTPDEAFALLKSLSAPPASR